MTRSPKETTIEPDHDQGLWERVKDTVSPLPTRKPAGPATRKTKPLPRNPSNKHRITENRDVRTSKAPAKQRRATSEDRSKHRKVRRGRIETHARVDLHGKTHDEAKAALLHKLEDYASENLRTILVITGRGTRDEGVLRTGLPNWMGEGSFRRLVSGYAPAHIRHGGKGAWYVFLRKNRTS